MRYQRWIPLAVLGVVLGVLWVPVYAVRFESPPRDETKYIRRVFGEHTVGQSFISEGQIDALEIVVRGEATRDALLAVSDETGQELGRATFTLQPADQSIRIPLVVPLEAGERTVTLRTLPEVLQPAAVHVRYQPGHTIFPDGTMFVDGEPAQGDIGFRALARVPLWRSLAIWGQITDRAAARGFTTVSAGLLIGVLLWTMTVVRGRQRWVLVVAVLAVVTVALRMPYVMSIEGVFGGDAFNYLSKTQALLRGDDLFATDPRKGPLYSLLLLPGFFTEDPLLWSRWVGVLAAAGAVVGLAFVGRAFSLPWGLAAGAGMLLAVNQDFIWESPSGLANTLYTCLIVAAVAVYLHRRARWTHWALAVLCGLIFLTRFEGGIVAVILLPALWWRERLPWRRGIALLGITAALMAVPQVSLLWSGMSGIRTVQDIAADDGLSLAESTDALLFNVSRFHRFLMRVWLIPESGVLVLPGLVLGVVGGGLLVVVRRRWPAISGGFWVMSVVGVASMVVLLLMKSSAAREYLVAVPWFFTGLGLIPLWRVRPYDTSVLLLLLVIHTAVITGILPKQRYYLPLIPFLSLFMAVGVRTFFSWNRSILARATPLLVIGVVVSLLWTDGRQSLLKRLEIYNTDAEYISVMLQAVKYLRLQHGNVGFSTDGEQTIVTFIQPERRFLFKLYESDRDPVQAELRWLLEHKIAYVVERNDERIWQSVRRYPALFEHRHTFDTLYGDSRVLVYRVHRSVLKETLLTGL